MSDSREPVQEPSATEGVNGARGRDSLFHLEAAAAYFLGVLLFFPLALGNLTPSLDGLQHLLHGWTAGRLPEGVFGYNELLEWGEPVSALGFMWVYSFLEPIVGWVRAYQLVLALIALGHGLAFRYLVHRITGRRHPLGLLGFALALGWPWFMGFLPFALATVVGLWLSGWVSHERALRTWEWIALSVGLAVVALLHFFPAILFGGAILVLRVAGLDAEKARGWNRRKEAFWPAPERRAMEAVYVGAAALPAFAVVVAVSSAGSETLSSVQGANVLFWNPWPTRIADLAQTSTGGPFWRSWPPLLAALAGMGIGLFRAASQPWSVVSLEQRRGNTVGILALLALITALVVPFHMTAWEFFGPRPLVLAIPLGLAALATALPQRYDRQVLVVAAVFSVLSMGWGHLRSRALAREVAPLMEADFLPPKNPPEWLLPIVFDVEGANRQYPVAYSTPLANVGHLISIRAGAMTPYLSASSPVMHANVFRSGVGPQEIPLRSYFEADVEPESRHGRALRDTLLRAGSSYDRVLAQGDEVLFELLEERGFVVENTGDDFRLAHFRGCPLTVTIQGSERSRVTRVESAWFPLLEPWEEGDLQSRGSIYWQADFERTPCGDVWIRVVAGLAEGPASCRGADPDGRILVHLRPDMEPVHCILASLPR